MALFDYKQDYYAHSSSASSVTRQAAFAGIALIWIFNNKVNAAITLPEPLLWPTLFFIMCLACDLLHYIISAAIWGAFHRYHEKKGVKQDSDISAPLYFNWPALGFFWGKHIFVLLGYYNLLLFVSNAIKFGSG